MLSRRSIVIYIIAIFVVFQNCSGGLSSEASSYDFASEYVPSTRSKWPPKLDVFWQQFGNLNANVAASVFIIDIVYGATSAPSQLRSAGKKVLCAFSAGVFEPHRADAGQIPASARGSEVVPGSGYNWLDIRDQSVRSVMVARLNTAAQYQCSGVLIDDLNAFNISTGFPLTANDTISYGNFLAGQAHALGLDIVVLSADGIESNLASSFDAALSLNCVTTGDCNKNNGFKSLGKPVMNLELTTKSPELCTQSKSLGVSTSFGTSNYDGTYFDTCP